ncbi:DegQ family serine endoprotease [Undibacterium umbellatum]|uniref:Probable periplasmic serine endoprotease DegP-like n=1 Tax=Undibacterium umbellatum TaxID=2762300 RepID=A0ABR6Z451_9BURK|nr:DegQ family serine endoprotease [Undibacterium umbellatum]MBC3906115.1 DegQ family serine endoprotease [Undibacterium umbellatum]
MKANRLFPFEKIASTLVLSACVGFIAPTAINANPMAEAAATIGLPDFTELVEKSGPAVVNIRTTERIQQNQGGGSAEDEQMQEFFRRFFGTPMPIPKQQPTPKGRKAPQQQEEEVSRGVGSGFIISQDGYVLTNAHVVDGASEVYVKLTDKREFKAKVVGADRRTDIAVLKIDGSKLPRVTVGDSDKIKAGEWVIAIGSPFDLDNTVTAGIISAKARDTGDYLPLIQTDVAVNPGNSGGPLINMRGEVIGVNSQIYSRSGGYMGISFAIPIDEAMRVVDQLKSSGKVVRGYLGVERIDVPKDVAEGLGLAKAQGALIQRVMPGSPAEKAGVEVGDVIQKVNGTVIDKAVDLNRVVGDIKPGGKATVTIWRKGGAKDIVITVAEADAEKSPVKTGKQKPEPSANVFGLSITDLTEVQKRDARVSGGVILESAEGGAARAGLQAGDIITRIFNADIKDAKEFAAVMAKVDQKKPVLLLVKRGDVSKFVAVRPTNQ